MATGTEDFAILLISLYRAYGYSPKDVYVTVGRAPDAVHAYVFRHTPLGWHVMELQVGGWLEETEADFEIWLEYDENFFLILFLPTNFASYREYS